MSIFNPTEREALKECLANASIVVTKGKYYIPSRQDPYGEIAVTELDVLRFLVSQEAVKATHTLYGNINYIRPSRFLEAKYGC